MELELWLFIGGMTIGYLWDRMRQRAALRRLVLHVFIQHPMATTPPTTTELQEPIWLQPGYEVNRYSSPSS